MGPETGGGVRAVSLEILVSPQEPDRDARYNMGYDGKADQQRLRAGGLVYFAGEEQSRLGGRYRVVNQWNQRCRGEVYGSENCDGIGAILLYPRN